MTQENKTKTAYLAGGCFWCLEAVFLRVKGVLSSVSGYAGGQTPEPTYEEVSTGMTGYAETVKLEYDPAVIAYDDLLSIFFYVHDPTSLNRQGNDAGTQYRSTVFYETEAQKTAAEEFIASRQASGEYKKPIVTTIEPLVKFYRAEEYHQRYFEKNPDKAYCQLVIVPKVEKFKAAYKKFFVV